MKENEKMKGKKREKRKEKRQGHFTPFTISSHLVKLFCQTFFKMTPTPPEEPLHQRSQSRSRTRFRCSRSLPKQALKLQLHEASFKSFYIVTCGKKKQKELGYAHTPVIGDRRCE
jgi:hypothetical protein